MKTNTETAAYQFTPYDVLQVSRDGGPWMDYSTIRTQDEAAIAIGIVDGTIPMTDRAVAWRIQRTLENRTVYTRTTTIDAEAWTAAKETAHTVKMSATILPTPHPCQRCSVPVYSCRATLCPTCETRAQLDSERATTYRVRFGAAAYLSTNDAWTRNPADARTFTDKNAARAAAEMNCGAAGYTVETMPQADPMHAACPACAGSGFQLLDLESHRVCPECTGNGFMPLNLEIITAWVNGPKPAAYTFDAQATADALRILQSASAASAHVRPVYEMTHSARKRLDAEMAAYLRPAE
jgi:hypothetical protein